MAKVLKKGNEAMAIAAMKGGMEAFFGYPITPQNEIPEYLSLAMPQKGLAFVQAESEVSAINMVYGAAAAGARAMTSSSSPGIALKQEGISYIAGANLPCVILNVSRGGPGLGDIQPAQSDYNQMTRGGGNGDYEMIVMAPENIQEAVDLIKESFDLADYYQNPVAVMADGLIGQMMEAVDFDRPTPKYDLPKKDWALTSRADRGEGKRDVLAFSLDAKKLEQMNYDNKVTYDRIRDEQQRYELYNCEDAEVVVVAFGTSARIARSAIGQTNKWHGHKVGMLRPIFVWPFPEKAFDELPDTVKAIYVIEMNMGQMLQDVKIVNNGRWKIGFFGRPGGVVPKPDNIVRELKKFVEELE